VTCEPTSSGFPAYSDSSHYSSVSSVQSELVMMVEVSVNVVETKRILDQVG